MEGDFRLGFDNMLGIGDHMKNEMDRSGHTKTVEGSAHC